MKLKVKQVISCYLQQIRTPMPIFTTQMTKICKQVSIKQEGNRV